MKKAHTLPHQSRVIIMGVANIYPFRRPDVKMTEKRDGVNRKMIAKREDYSAKVKKIQDAMTEAGENPAGAALPGDKITATAPAG
ncbi:hypothetical protein [Superficieibacter sp. 1612_C1]|uniref:hypothetical protein n=1 Tax=Superficieibacter sp. 1612_C1 TaxID=2780382 RepID=UPI001883ED6B|nr:hypothetical protein [Superficieibacter sp. 1612_C1]